ncbi:hypothetical protein CU097_010372 [Rhizopus azygosporus]|uniref:Uncharacterized protein n=1 Tax=Rhizopus azygosporus TaxID=86630 RepID=A0A367JQL6_RHIAZ|nr:hypothetical protein CU097_010372 [Rhizopus azygosporus]
MDMNVSLWVSPASRYADGLGYDMYGEERLVIEASSNQHKERLQYTLDDMAKHVAAFLRPSDLARISLLSVTVDEELKLRFNIVVPKERRNGRRIIKPVLIHSHNARNLCPVVSFLALKDRPKVTVSRPPGTLFVNALDCSLRIADDLPLALEQENGTSSDDGVFFGAEDTIQND